MYRSHMSGANESFFPRNSRKNSIREKISEVLCGTKNQQRDDDDDSEWEKGREREEM